MYDEQKILEELNAVGLSDEAQQAILDDVAIRVGEALERSLNDQQYNEYRAIIDANQDVISAWLAQHMPAYKQTDLYKELAAHYPTDPERVQPEKVIAAFGWVDQNVKNMDEIVAQAVNDYKEERITAVEAIDLVQ